MYFDEKQNEQLNCANGPSLDQLQVHSSSAVTFKNMPSDTQQPTNIAGLRFSSQTHVGDYATNKQQVKNYA